MSELQFRNCFDGAEQMRLTRSCMAATLEAQDELNKIWNDEPHTGLGRRRNAIKIYPTVNVKQVRKWVRNRINEPPIGSKGIVQSVIVDKSLSLPEARIWVKDHGYKDKGVEIKPKHFRFRQIEPEVLKKKGLTKFRTVPLGHEELIVAYPPAGKKGKSIGSFSVMRKI